MKEQPSTNSKPFLGQPNTDWGDDIFVIGADGGAPQRALKHDRAGAQVYGLAWTPDGKALLLGYNVTIIADGKYQGQQRRIDRLDLSSGQRTPLIDDAVFPSISRDGKRLAYLQQNDKGFSGIWIANPDGSAAQQLVDQVREGFAAILFPRLSPDGMSVAFAAFLASGVQDGTSGARSGLLQAILGPLWPRSAFAHGAPMDIWRVDLTGSAPVRLTHFNEDEPYPAWSRDGRTLTVLGGVGLHQVSADGSTARDIGSGAFGAQVDVKW